MKKELKEILDVEELSQGMTLLVVDNYDSSESLEYVEMIDNNKIGTVCYSDDFVQQDLLTNFLSEYTVYLLE